MEDCNYDVSLMLGIGEGRRRNAERGTGSHKGPEGKRVGGREHTVKMRGGGKSKRQRDGEKEGREGGREKEGERWHGEEKRRDQEHEREGGRTR